MENAPSSATQKASKGGNTRRKGQTNKVFKHVNDGSNGNSKDKGKSGRLSILFCSILFFVYSYFIVIPFFKGSSLREFDNLRTDSPTDSIDSTTGSVASQSSTHSAKFGNQAPNGMLDQQDAMVTCDETPGHMPEYQYTKV